MFSCLLLLITVQIILISTQIKISIFTIEQFVIKINRNYSINNEIIKFNIEIYKDVTYTSLFVVYKRSWRDSKAIHLIGSIP